jgi:hypothetical protein
MPLQKASQNSIRSFQIKFWNGLRKMGLASLGDQIILVRCIKLFRLGNPNWIGLYPLLSRPPLTSDATFGRNIRHLQHDRRDTAHRS